MIASVAIEHRVPLLHNDRDFGKIAKHTNLAVVKSAKAPGMRPRSRS
jgi:predicted nucleic acid-binding protein